MNVLVKSARIIDPKSDFHNETADILIEDGIIKRIGSSLKNPNNFKVLNFENLHISRGWFDSSVSLGEPGFEERETISNGLRTAGLSGFTSVAVNPNTFPVIDTSGDVSYLKSKAHNSATRLYPIGALTKTSSGSELAELFDMHQAGAVAYNDYQKPISDPNLMKLALQYADNFGGLVLSFPLDSRIARNGVMHEYITSTSLGLKGIPSLSEELQIARDLSILNYTGGKLHIPTISTQRSVELIRRAKENKLDVTCSVAIHNLVFTDSSLEDFNTNFKVLPPLRSEQDQAALIDGLKDGTIDLVTSDHNPIDIEHKQTEFDNAYYGSIGLETAFGALNEIFTVKKTIDLLTRGKSLFTIEESAIAVGKKADLTLFNPKGTTKFSKEHIHSTSKNSMFLNSNLKGQTYGIIANHTSELKL